MTTEVILSQFWNTKIGRVVLIPAVGWQEVEETYTPQQRKAMMLFAGDASPMCCKQEPTRGFVCTCRKGHAHEAHIATGAVRTNDIFAVWYDEEK